MPCRCEFESSTVPERMYLDACEKVDEVTRLLCFCCGTLFDMETEVFGSAPQLLRWWKKHHSSDTSRVREKMKIYVNDRKKTPSSHGVANHFINAAEKSHPVSEFHKRWFAELAREVCTEHANALMEKKRACDLKQQALEKLTDEEREALGIK